MSRLIDPTICPDCRSVLSADRVCTGCGLRLSGPVAVQLWNTMLGADSLIERLRAQPEGAAPASLPAYEVPASKPRRRLPAASVPAVLLSLGGLCLLVAGIVFVAVTWSHLGLAGRTAVLLGFTAVLAGVAALVTRRGLRGAAETFWTVVAGMLTVDLVAAHSAGLAGLDSLSGRGTAALVGSAALVLGLAVGEWARSQPVRTLLAPQVVAVAGAGLVVATNAWSGGHQALATSIAILALLAIAWLVRQALPVTAAGLAGIAGMSWLMLLTEGLQAAGESSGDRAWWLHLQGWPLLVAAVLAAALALAPVLPPLLRPFAAASALGSLVLLAFGPDASSTSNLTTTAVVLALLAGVTGLAPGLWGRAGALLTAPGSLVVAAIVLYRPWETPSAARWTALAVGVAVVLAGWSLLRGRVLALAPGLLAIAATTMLLESDTALWLPVTALALTTAVFLVPAVVRHDELPVFVAGLALSAYTLLTALRAADSSDLLSALLATAAAVGLATAYVGSRRVPAVFAAATVVLGGLAVTDWGRVADLPDGRIAVLLAAYAGLAVVCARWLRRDLWSRMAIEVSGLVVALPALGLAGSATTAAMVLTLVGGAICLVAVLDGNRTVAGWAGAAVLGVATVLRLDADVRAPELYTLPVAALLVAVGVWRLQGDTEAGSIRLLGSGLTLGLLPSLLIALDEPVSLRGALVAAAGLAVLAVGMLRGWAAPFVAGAVTTAVLAVRHLGPVAEALPRWISLGTVGLALLLVGVTWEARRRDVTGLNRYLTALR